jgi:hypothetical protein
VPLLSTAIVILSLLFRVCDFTPIFLKAKQHVTLGLDGQFDGVKSVVKWHIYTLVWYCIFALRLYIEMCIRWSLT